MRRYNAYALFCLCGAVLGYILLHPYTMLVYALMHLSPVGDSQLHWKDLSQAFAAFDPLMIPMGVSFAVFGGIIGFMIGLLIERNKRLYASEHDAREKKIALETLKELVVTLAHYLLNANMIIGGKVRRCRKATADQEILASLAVIEEQGRKIDAVISALRESTEIRVSNYTSDGTIKLIDLESEIERRMNEREPGNKEQ